MHEVRCPDCFTKYFQGPGVQGRFVVEAEYKTYADLWWSSFCSIWTWIVHQNMLVQVNKYLIDDLARSEELLEKATIKLNKKWTVKS